MSSIQPKGRLKYGTYMSKSNIYSKVSSSFYNGNTSTGGGTPASGVTPDPVETCVLLLNHNSFTFDRSVLAVKPQKDTIQVIGYRGTEMREVFVSNLSGLIDEDDVSTTTQSPTYDITGLTSGMTVTVSGNGSSACTISIEVDSSITVSKGTLLIPVSMCLDANGLEDNYLIWKGSNDENTQALGGTSGSLYSTVLEYYWELDSESQSSYVLDLTNDSAGINVDSSGNVLAGATKPTCKATLYYGQEVVTGATFGISTNAAAAASGVSINTSTGVLTFGNNFNFVGSSLEITVSATYLGHTSIKIMTVSKNYPGADGTGATTRWIVPSVSAIKVDPNTGTITPATVSATVMKQTGEDEPVEDSTTTIWYDWDIDKPNNIYSEPIPVVAAHSYLALGLKNGNGDFYELETIPILEDGVNGSNGANGQSVYRLDLSNESATINCDINGNLLPGAVRPKCTATLYYGVTKVSNAVYSFGETYADGLTIDGSTGEITVGNDFTWEGTSIGIVVNATEYKILRGTATFTLSKNFPGANGANGADGTDAVNYWLALDADAIQVTSGGTASPSTISCKAYKQVGGNTPVELTSAETPYIYYGYNTKNPSTRYSGETLTIDETKNYLTFRLWDENNNTQYDIETIPILHDGKNGKDGQGRQGAAIRGPVEWLSTAARRWCSGKNNADGVSTEEDEQYIDVIFRIVDSKKVYYVCTKSYTQEANTDWGTVSQYWKQTDEQYEFVASKVLLADNAYIDFLTGNEIYLRDSGGTVTAGAAGGNGISFWAGRGPTPEDEISGAPFQVNYDGSLKSTKGTFGCLTIGEDSYGRSSLFGQTGDEKYNYELNMSPEAISFKGSTDLVIQEKVINLTEVVAICPNRNSEAPFNDYEGAINILNYKGNNEVTDRQKTAIKTNETIKAARFSQETHMRVMPDTGGVLSTPGLFGLEIVFQTSTPSGTTYFTKDGDNNTWRFLGMDTNVNYNLNPYVEVQDFVSASDIPKGENTADYIGYWAFYASPNGGKIWSGIAGPNVEKNKSGIMYIQV